MGGLNILAVAAIPEWVTTFGTAIGLAIVVGGVAAGFWASRSKGIIELLKTENSAYKDSNARLHEENVALKQECASAKAEVRVWRDNVTQRPSIEKLIATSTKQHGEYMLEMGKVTSGLTGLTEAITKMLSGGNK